jgi:hypothetical protein
MCYYINCGTIVTRKFELHLVYTQMATIKVKVLYCTKRIS